MTQELKSVLITDQLTSEGSFKPSLYFKGSDIAQRLKESLIGYEVFADRKIIEQLIAELEQKEVRP
jgi:hypothetical protein